MARVVRSGWLMQGPEVEAFEHEFATFVGAPHAVAVSSGTAALELALRLLRIGPGDEVVTVSHSFIATANCITAVGARPVFVDVEEDTFGMDPAQVQAAVGPRTKAILVAHQVGIPCDLPDVGVPVIEDAACALGSERLVGRSWQRLGRPHGRIACFSFHPRKVLTTGDGGMLTMADEALATRARLLRNHAITPDGFPEPGFNLRLTDLQAAVGRPQLRRLDASLAERRRLAAAFGAALAGHPVLVAPTERPDRRTNWQSYPVRTRGDAAAAMRHFTERGISCRPGLTNAHQEPAHRGAPLPVSERLQATTIFLPLFHGLTVDEQNAVTSAIAAFR